ncbi:unnamed protein product [Amoebophrya sp. A120]|nr:unnamed protein product [Amoebophrya sp. A120]|eukprot:GSA120T00004489001.1
MTSCYLFLHVEELKTEVAGHNASTPSSSSSKLNTTACANRATAGSFSTTHNSPALVPYVRAQLLGDVIYALQSQSTLIPSTKILQFRIHNPEQDVLKFTVHDDQSTEDNDGAVIGHLTLPLRCITDKPVDIWRVDYQLETTNSTSGGGGAFSTSKGGGASSTCSSRSLQLVIQYLPRDYISEYRNTVIGFSAGNLVGNNIGTAPGSSTSTTSSINATSFERTLEELRKHFREKVTTTGGGGSSGRGTFSSSTARTSNGAATSTTSLSAKIASTIAASKVSTDVPASSLVSKDTNPVSSPSYDQYLSAMDDVEANAVTKAYSGGAQAQHLQIKPTKLLPLPGTTTGKPSGTANAIPSSSRNASRNASPSNHAAKSRAGLGVAAGVSRNATPKHNINSSSYFVQRSQSQKSITTGANVKSTTILASEQQSEAAIQQLEAEVQKHRAALLEAGYQNQDLVQQIQDLNQQLDFETSNSKVIIESQTKTILEKNFVIKDLEENVVQTMKEQENNLLTETIPGLEEKIRILQEENKTHKSFTNDNQVKQMRLENEENQKKIISFRKFVDETNEKCGELVGKNQNLLDEISLKEKEFFLEKQNFNTNLLELKHLLKEEKIKSEAAKKELTDVESELHFTRQRNLELEAEKEAQRTIAANTVLEVEKLRGLLAGKAEEVDAKEESILALEKQQSILELSIRKLEADNEQYRQRERGLDAGRAKEEMTSALDQHQSQWNKVSNEYVAELEAENSLLKQQFDLLLTEHKSFLAKTVEKQEENEKKAKETEKTAKEKDTELLRLRETNINLEKLESEFNEVVKKQQLPDLQKKLIDLKNQLQFSQSYSDELVKKLRDSNAKNDELQTELECDRKKFAVELREKDGNCSEIGLKCADLEDKLQRSMAKVQHLVSTKYTPHPHDIIDQTLAKWIQGFEPAVPFFRVQQGVYLFGKRQVNVQINNEKPVFRVGGGFLPFEQFVEKFEQEELEKWFLNKEQVFGKNLQYREQLENIKMQDHASNYVGSCGGDREGDDNHVYFSYPEKHQREFITASQQHPVGVLPPEMVNYSDEEGGEYYEYGSREQLHQHGGFYESGGLLVE